MARRGYAGALILNGDFYQHFARDLGQVSGTATTLFAVVPVTNLSYKQARARARQAAQGVGAIRARCSTLSMGSIHLTPDAGPRPRRRSWMTQLARCAPKGLSGAVHDQFDGQHVARQAHRRARLC